MRPSQETARAGESFGPYQLVRQLAVGGMAEIYLARATGLSGFEKFVALKMIHPNYAEDAHFIDMLVEEAKIVVHLTQPNIVQIFDLGRIGDVHYIAMEYVDGLDLYHILRNITEVGELLDFDVAAFIALELSAALDYAHRCRDQLGRPLGIIHRDISPQNILVSKAGEVKLADFGIAKASVRARQTAVGVIKGKYYYMSPEQAWGDTVDHRTDIFSTGVVLYESIVGQMLYLDEDLGMLLDKVRKAEIAPPSVLRPDVPGALQQIVLRAVARRPEDRFQTAHEFQLALQRFLYSHAPHFNLGRVRDVVLHATALEDKKHVHDPAGPGSAVGTAPAKPRPPAPVSISFSSHSLLPPAIVRTGEKKLASLPDWGDDFDGATVVSDPPLMLAHLNPELTGSPPPPTILPISMDGINLDLAPPDVGWEDADETTTLVARGKARPRVPPTGQPAPPGPAQPGPAGPAQPGPALPAARAVHKQWPGAPAAAGQQWPGAPAAAGQQWPGAPGAVQQPWPGAPGAPPQGLAQGPGPRGPGQAMASSPAGRSQAPVPPGPAPGQAGPAHGAVVYQPQPGGPPPGTSAAQPGVYLPPLGAGGGPMPTYRPGPIAAPSPFDQGVMTDEVDRVEERLANARRRLVRILVAAGIGVLVLGLVLVIVSARKSLQEPGSVLVESEPAGAKVHYRGRVVGVTPHRLDSLPVDEEHSVRLEHPRCESTPALLKVEAGKTLTTRVKLNNCD